MLLKKKVKAGILLYALLMLAVFSLLLQFYLHRQEAESQIAQLAKQEATAYIMAQMVLDQVGEELRERQAVAKEVASQTDEIKEDAMAASQTVDEKEKKEEQPTRESQETAEKPAQTSSEQSKPIEDKGTVTFQEGQASYHVKNKQVSIVVEVRKGGRYHYQFPVNSSLEGE
ncbi:competence protein ComGG [Streptococcus suis]|nr:competence protein ComGG [Streptococcus suis]